MTATPALREVVAPSEYRKDSSDAAVFLAGGISGCPDWQAELCAVLAGLDAVFLNPRRRAFDIHDGAVTLEQIAWEFHHLRKADAILFWFPEETLCPIALFELGAWSMTSTPLFVGTHPAYSRRIDVEAQLALVRPEIAVCPSLAALALQVRDWRGAR